MHPSKRTWIYAGLGMPAQIGLVSQSRPNGARMQRGAKMLLIGDQSVRGLAPPLEALARDAGVILHCEGRLNTTAQDWAQQPWLAPLLQPKPQLVLLSLPPGPLQPLCTMAALHGSRAVWITPPATGPVPAPPPPKWGQCTVFPTYALRIPRGPDQLTPTAAGFAGWAGVLWRFLRHVR